jgi:hypothetical protein
MDGNASHSERIIVPCRRARHLSGACVVHGKKVAEDGHLPPTHDATESQSRHADCRVSGTSTSPTASSQRPSLTAASCPDRRTKARTVYLQESFERMHCSAKTSKC